MHSTMNEIQTGITGATHIMNTNSSCVEPQNGLPPFCERYHPSPSCHGGQCHFFKLPTEIRLQIYELALRVDGPLYLTKEIWNRPPESAHPKWPSFGLLGVSHQIRKEALEAFYTKNSFIFHNRRTGPESRPPATASELSQWLDCLRMDAIASLKHLTIMIFKTESRCGYAYNCDPFPPNLYCTISLEFGDVISYSPSFGSRFNLQTWEIGNSPPRVFYRVWNVAAGASHDAAWPWQTNLKVLTETLFQGCTKAFWLW